MEYLLTMGMITVGMLGLGKPQLFNQNSTMRLHHIRVIAGLVWLCGILVAVSNIMLKIG